MLLIPCIRKSGAGSIIQVTDPYWANVVLLMGMETPGSPAGFVDESLSAHTFTVADNAQPASDQFKFGAYAYKGDGTGDEAIVEDGPGSPSNAFSDFNFGSDDWTVEAWIRAAALANFKTIVAKDPSGAGRFKFGILADGSLFTERESDLTPITAAGIISANIWYHVAACRVGATTRLFVDGVDRASAASNTMTAATTEKLKVGGDPAASTNAWDGWIDELRVTKGVGRYTASFTPPTAAFPRG